ncbi:MAG: saccharopine dehydrogenase NADP-binding domain-containing protein [Rhodoluna sp.]|nr:saccharopine dehydrogenase NADP-binding domain-containing protein [Rhodoluna sp.]
MRILLVGAGGVGDAVAKLAAERDFYELFVISDYDLNRAERTLEWIANRHGDEVAQRFLAIKIDASNAAVVAATAKEHGITHVLNAVEPKFVPTIFSGAFTAGANYVDMAMSLSEPHETDPFHQPGLKLGDQQYALNEQWERAGLLALVGMGVEPGLSNVFARYAQDHLFSEIDEISVKDGGNLVVRDEDGNEIFAPSFSIWTTIEECLNPPIIWEEGRGFYTTEPFSEPEIFEFPEGIGAVECVNVEHEEVTMLSRTLKAKKIAFKYGLGQEFIGILQTLHKLGLDQTKPHRVRSAQGPVDVAPRDLVAAVLPDPATIGPRMEGKTCAGVLVTGKDFDGKQRATYIYQVADNAESMAKYEAQAVVWQTAFNPLVALELIAKGEWSGSGVVGPEVFAPIPFLALLSSSTGYNVKWVAQERMPASPLRHP